MTLKLFRNSGVLSQRQALEELPAGASVELRQGQESNSFSLHGKMGQPGLAFHSASLFKFSRLAAIGAQYKNKKTGLQRALKM